MTVLARLLDFVKNDGKADRVVPPTGYTAILTVLSAGAMAFLAVFAIAFSLATHRLADRWGSELAQSATIRISAPADQLEAQTAAVLSALAQTPGVAAARRLDRGEQQALLAPWFGTDLPLDTLPLPELIEVIEGSEGYDAEGLRLRLQAEAPGAVLDDHTRWRQPLVDAADRLNALGLISLILIAATMVAMIALAAFAALAANEQIISVLRQVGAEDRFIARAFVRRFSLRALLGAAVGALAGAVSIALLPSAGEASFLTGFGFQGLEWFWLVVVPLLAAGLAYVATSIAALRRLREIA